LVQVAAYAQNPDDVDTKEKMLAGIYPHFKQALLKSCPPELRQDYVEFFPELLTEELKVLLGMSEAEDGARACVRVYCRVHVLPHGVPPPRCDRIRWAP
jgi:hypothetical protein